MKGLFVFRRDLRYQDNTGLYNACKECEEVICLFILTSKQINKNKYFSNNAFSFMLETLIELKKDIPVIMEYGEPEKIIIQIVKKYNIDSVYLNTDYTPYSIERDKKISEALTKIKKQFKKKNIIL